MKKTKCMGTSKNKRAMSGGSGGKGRVSRYTKKFRKCYENFRKIAESDPNDIKNDDTKIRKMEEWGRLRGIYTYLKSKNIEGNDVTFLDKMKKNIPGSTIKKYTNAMSCLENDSAILLERGCVLEKDYVNIKKIEDITIVESKKAEEQTEEQNEKAREEVRKAQEEAEKARQDMQRAQEEAETARQDMQRATAAPSTIEGDDQSEAPVSDAPAEETPATVAEVSNDAVGQSGIAVDEAPAQADNTVVQSDVSDVSDVSHDPAKVTPVGDAEAPAPYASVGQPGIAVDEAPDIDADADAEKQRADQGGGRSKRRQKYSRRRGKSMKSKKGRKTRRR